jgi:hypothetical protein
MQHDERKQPLIEKSRQSRITDASFREKKGKQGAVLTGISLDDEDPETKSVFDVYRNSIAQDNQRAKENERPQRVSERIKILLATVGFFSDAYDLLVINIVLIILTSIYEFTAPDKSIVTTSALVGAVFGQLSFGVLADIIGRFPVIKEDIEVVFIDEILRDCSVIFIDAMPSWLEFAF